MKLKLKSTIFILSLCSIFLLVSCSKDNGNNDQPDPDDACYVQLFDGDRYTDDNIIIKGAGEYANLENLPGATKNWDDEADSFKSGKNTTVTFYTEPDFKGESVTYRNGAEEPSMDEPRSMKITCGGK